jgi:hypothetical protein
MEVPCFNNNQQAWQKRLFWRLRLGWVAAGCILVLQAVRLSTKVDLPTSVVPPPPLFKEPNSGNIADGIAAGIGLYPRFSGLVLTRFLWMQRK